MTCDTDLPRPESLEQGKQDERVREIKLLKFAEKDMRQARAAALALLERETDEHLWRALETAIAVCYSRPFTRSLTLGKLGDDWQPQDAELCKLHVRLIELRHRLYAHIEHDTYRDVEPFGEDGLVEGWRPIRRPLLPKIVLLCEKQAERFERAAKEHLARLREEERSR